MTTAVDEQVSKPRRAKKSEASLLFDAPGPRARARNNIIAVVGALILLGIIYLIYARLDQKNQFSGKLWHPYVESETWTKFVIPGLLATLYAAAIGSVAALIFGVVFGLGRLSDHRWVRIPAAAIVEFFRAIPLLILIFFVFSVPPTIATAFDREIPEITPFMAVVVGLTLYNGSVLAEVFRAGILSIPKGQSEAAFALGLRKNGVMRLVLVPQAVTAMMPTIVAQLVVLLKDSALGQIIAYSELLDKGFYQMKANYGNAIAAVLVTGAIYIAINISLGFLANRLERRSRRSRKSTATTMGGGIGAPPAVGMSTTSVRNIPPSISGDTGGI